MVAMSVDPIRRAMVVLMFVGAANADATPEQRARLRDEVLPPLRDESIPARDAYVRAARVVVDVMGPEWRPAGEWDEWITALLGEASCAS